MRVRARSNCRSQTFSCIRASHFSVGPLGGAHVSLCPLGFPTTRVPGGTSQSGVLSTVRPEDARHGLPLRPCEGVVGGTAVGGWDVALMGSVLLSQDQPLEQLGFAPLTVHSWTESRTQLCSFGVEPGWDVAPLVLCRRCESRAQMVGSVHVICSPDFLVSLCLLRLQAHQPGAVLKTGQLLGTLATFWPSLEDGDFGALRQKA